METEKIHVEKHLRRGAKTYLNDVPNVVRALTEINSNPEEFNVRVEEFSNVLAAFNTAVCLEEDLGSEYSNLLHYRRIMDRHPVPLPRSILDRDKRHYLYTATKTFIDVNYKIEKGEWRFPLEVKDANVLTSAFLIEGYGLFLEKLYDAPGLSRSFVLGFEEVLWNRFRDSSLLKDVLPWMRDEVNSFSPKMAQELLVDSK